MDVKINPTVRYIQEDHCSFKKIYKQLLKGGKHILYKWKAKESRGGYIYITQNICQHKRHNSDKESHYTIIRRSVHQRRCNNHKYLCTQYWST